MKGETSKEVGAMPKEIVHSSDVGTSDGTQSFAVVGWSRDVGHVQVGVGQTYDLPHPNTRTIPDVLREELTDPKWSNGSNYDQTLDQMIDVWERGWFCTLDRAGINRMIRMLRKARDAAFGTDA